VLGPTFAGKSSNYKPSFTLFQYISTYAPAGDAKNDPTEYTNFIINWFKQVENIDINANTTLEQIRNIR
jgi:hypothetical protein